MTEIFKKWIPIESLPNTLYLEGLHHDYEGFRLILKGEEKTSKTMRILFDAVFSYRNCDEGDRLKVLQESSGLLDWTLYTVENSDYLRWFHDSSYNIRSDEKIVHYAIYTPNDCVDILSAFPPTVEWLN